MGYQQRRQGTPGRDHAGETIVKSAVVMSARQRREAARPIPLRERAAHVLLSSPNFHVRKTAHTEWNSHPGNFPDRAPDPHPVERGKAADGESILLI
jgi:hypothetical protein